MSTYRYIIAGIYLFLVAFATFATLSDPTQKDCEKEKKPYIPVVFITLLFIHAMALIAIFAIKNPKWITIAFIVFLSMAFGLSITAGQHRLYTHESYTVNNQALEWFYFLFNLVGMSSPTIEWVKTHKQHHKYSDTCKDPHFDNTFRYSHIGWIIRDHEIEQEILNTPTVKNVQRNKILQFQKQYYIPLVIIVQIILFMIPLLWGDFWNGFWLHFIRLVIGLNAEFSVNSLAHYFGYRPYDPTIKPSQNLLVTTFGMGEGYHNYHHTYPKDFRASGSFYNLNPTTWFLLLCYRLGWISNLRFHLNDDEQINPYPYEKEIIDDTVYHKLT